ncbi:MAG: hypothetical protein E4H28_04990 [Gemmatimonadales bacterium]|nr:MAG: hypothetical protein E4H28_04990 [Gemmatimonadales bacterium]
MMLRSHGAPSTSRLGSVAATLLAVLLLLTPSTLQAQQASPYLALDHWAYPILELWIARGDVTDLSPFTRPYRIVDVLRAAESLDDADLSASEAGLRDRIVAELTRPATKADATADETGGYFDVGLEAGGRLVTQTHPDPLQAVLDGPFGDARVLERFDAVATGSSRYVAGGVRIRRDGIYRHDPRFPDGQVTSRRDGPFTDDLSVRVEEGYVELQIPFLRLGVGRLDRDWGPAATGGFLRSANPYSADELTYRIGTDRIFLIGSISAPSDFGADTVRYVSMHRLEVRPSDRLMLAVSESVVYGGPDARFQFALANPIGIWQIALDDGEIPHNKLGQADVWWRASRGIALTGSLLADATNLEGSCCQMGGSLGVELADLAPGLLVRAQATAIQSLAYRTSLPWEEYSLDRIGFGQDKSDLVLASLQADWYASPALRISPRIDLQVRGEGDFRQLRPPDEELPDLERLIIGVSETTLRPAIAGRWIRPGDFRIDIEWDAGVSIISDYATTEGDDRTELTGSVSVRLATPRWGFGLR